ncbi:RCC1 domain-containing protein [Nonomuraea mangrovi]|uniref:RCC1 domain-containing protein n=1 Tax=Nonomuraea mangrovi TaxID=2316207 RepID=A0ABW4THF7_9ACTN
MVGRSRCRDARNGQLGDGSLTLRPAPVSVSGLSNVRAIAAGTQHSLALMADGAVRAWGYNGYGHLGDGTFTDRPAPVTVTGLSHVTAIAPGAYHNLVIQKSARCFAVRIFGFRIYICTG